MTANVTQQHIWVWQIKKDGCTSLFITYLCGVQVYKTKLNKSVCQGKDIHWADLTLCSLQIIYFFYFDSITGALNKVKLALWVFYQYVCHKLTYCHKPFVHERSTNWFIKR